MDSKCQDPASASECALRRHSSKVGAVCSNPARTDLCGGRWATGVPTATILLRISDVGEGEDVFVVCAEKISNSTTFSAMARSNNEYRQTTHCVRFERWWTRR